MGGCRCCFRECEVSTVHAPGTHFFHFPVKDKERLDKWIIFAKRPDFHGLPVDKLKNKVVCQNHFRMKHFMNYKKERITKFAVPTLYEIDSVTIDLETNLPADLENKTGKFVEAPISLNEMMNNKRKNSDMTLDIHIDKMVKVDKSPIANSNPKAEPSMVHKPNRVIKILNKSVASENVPQYPVFKVISNPHASLPTVIQKPMPAEGAFEVINVVDIKKSLANSITIKNVTEETFDDKTYFDLNGIHEEEVETEIVSSPEKSHTEIERPLAVRKVLPKTPPSKASHSNLVFMQKAIIEQKTQIENVKTTILKKMDVLNEKIQNQESSQSMPNFEKSSMSKIQLFNGIKRYLNPAMIALLRMEMFASSEREYKQDEKEIAIELSDLGDNVYKYIRDEWRFRLPSKKDVDKWKNMTMDEETEDM